MACARRRSDRVRQIKGRHAIKRLGPCRSRFSGVHRRGRCPRCRRRRPRRKCRSPTRTSARPWSTRTAGWRAMGPTSSRSSKRKTTARARSLDAIPGRAALAARLAALSETIERLVGRRLAPRRVLLREDAAGRELGQAVRAIRRRRRRARAGRPRHDDRPAPSDLVLRPLERRDARRGRSRGGRFRERERARRRRRDRHDAARRSDRADFGVTSWSDDGKAFYYLKRQDDSGRRFADARSTSTCARTATCSDSRGSTDVAVFGAGVNPTSPCRRRRSPRSASRPSRRCRRRADQRRRPVRDRLRRAESALSNPATMPWKLVITSRRQSHERGRAREHGLRDHRERRAALQDREVRRRRRSVAQATDVDPRRHARDRQRRDRERRALRAVARRRARAASRASATTARRARSRCRSTARLAGSATEYDRPGFLAQLDVVDDVAALVRVRSATRTRCVDTKLDPPSPVDYSDHRRRRSESTGSRRHDDPALDRSPARHEARRLEPDAALRVRLVRYLNRARLLGRAHGVARTRRRLRVRARARRRRVRRGVASRRQRREQGQHDHRLHRLRDVAGGAALHLARQSSARAAEAPAASRWAVRSRARRNLFAAVLDEIPVSDQLRIETTPNGPPNIPGVRQRHDRSGLQEPLRHQRRAPRREGHEYPAVMLTTGHQRSARRPVAGREDGRDAARCDGGPQADPAARRLRRRPRCASAVRARKPWRSAPTNTRSLLWQFGDPAFQPKL